MAQGKPKIAFLFPYRWLKEDRAFLDENLRLSVLRQTQGETEPLEEILAYRIVVSYHYKEPITIPLTKTDVGKAFKKLFTNGKCLSVDVRYAQHDSKTLLPLCDFQIYWA